MRIVYNMVAGAVACVVVSYLLMVIVFEMPNSVRLLPISAVLGLMFGAVISVMKGEDGEYRFAFPRSIWGSFFGCLLLSGIIIIVLVVLPIVLSGWWYLNNF